MSYHLKVLGREIISVGKSAPTTMAVAQSQLSNIDPSTFRGFDVLNGSIFNPKYITTNDFTEAYLKCPVLGTVIARKSSAFSEGIITAKNIINGEDFKDDKWINLLRNPNPFQTEDQFKTQLYTYCSIYGYALAIKDPVGVGTSWDIKNIWALPMNLIDVKFKKGNIINMTAEDLIESIYMTVEGNKIPLDKENVYMFTYKGPSVSNEGSFRNPIVPTSPFCGIERPIENVIAAYEASGSMIMKRGALGAFVNRSSDAIGVKSVSEEDKKVLQQAWGRYGLMDNQKKAIITDANVDWVQIAMKVKDLMLHEEIHESSATIADRFGYPSHLLSYGKQSTFNNMEIADKRVYTNSVITEADHFIEQLNAFLDAENNGFYYDIDFSHVEALQEDKKFAAEARKKLNDALKIEYESNQITKNEWRKKLGEEEVPGWDLYKYQFDKMINESNQSNDE